MFIVPTYVSSSPIHGIGVFAGEDISDKQEIWHFARGLDLVIPFDTIRRAPQAFQDYIEMYAYISPQIEGGMILSCDHAKFLNHSDQANTTINGEITTARGDIKKGEEITCDYRICCAGWTGF